MKTVYICLLAGVVLLTYGCSSGESYFRTGFDFSKIEKVAVIDVQGDIAGEAVKNQIGDFFAMELLKKGYAPVERAQVQALLKEQRFQATDATSREGIAQAGRILNVSTVLLVNIPNFGEEISITAKMLDVEDGSILWMGNGSGSTGRTLSTIFGAGAGAAAGAVVASEEDEIIGAIAGGVLGGVAGRALSPQKAVKTREIVAKLCKSLPFRLPVE